MKNAKAQNRKSYLYSKVVNHYEYNNEGDNAEISTYNLLQVAEYHMRQQEDYYFNKGLSIPAFACDLQNELADLGFYTGAIDGKFGPASLEALKEYCKC